MLLLYSNAFKYTSAMSIIVIKKMNETRSFFVFDWVA